MASNKSVKSQLKAAKAALGKKDYQDVSRICQDILAVEEGNYMAHVFAGLAAVELDRPVEARQHYKTAITAQPTDPLAWKGLANYYDKHPPSGQEEVSDALQTYQSLLPHVESDVSKKRSTLSSLASVYHTAGDIPAMVATYSSLIETYPPQHPGGGGGSSDVTGVWMTLTDILLQQKSLQQTAWDMLVRGVEVVLELEEEERKLSTRERLLPLLLDRYKESGEEEEKEMLWRHCRSVLETKPLSLSALTATVFLCLEDIITILPGDPRGRCGRDWTAPILEVLPTEEEGGGGGGGGGGREKQTFRSLACVGVSCLKISNGQWKEACSLLEKGVTLCPMWCEPRLLLTWINLQLYHFTTALQHAHMCARDIERLPKVIAGQANHKLKQMESMALLELGKPQQALSILLELVEKGSCDCHVTMTLSRVHLALGDIQSAETVTHKYSQSSNSDAAVTNILQGEIAMAKRNYDQAISWFEAVLETGEQCWIPECLLLKGLSLWNAGNSRASYATLLKAAKADPYNPKVMLYIGHYQRQIAGDVSRALKCYQKAVQLRSDYVEALSCSGDLLFSTGREEEAFTAYSEVTKRVPVTRAKQAWLRLGLYHRKKGQYNDAIHCFQKSLTTDTTDKQCWECLAEAYLARGSHTSALRTFTRVVELDPDSVYCLYQLGNIHQVRSELREAVARYSAVLDLQPHYLPALKGRGYTHYLIALSCLKQTFDAKAVHHVSLALTDLTKAASIKPGFLCVWKLIGDCCSCLHQVHPTIARVSCSRQASTYSDNILACLPAIPEVLLGKEVRSLDANTIVDQNTLFLIGCRSYAKAIQLSPECSSLWHDLALTYYHQAQIADTEETKSEYMATAFSMINKALSINPRDHTHWNLLGVIASNSRIGKEAVAQHAFISSIQLESNNGLAWTNLGALYLKNGAKMLAHKAFSTAQSLDPGCTAAWIGQAIIAHDMGSIECMDLFRHTTTLGYHSDGSHGYGYWVCHTLSNLPPEAILEPGSQQLNDIAMRGLLQARDCLQRLVEREPDNVWALNHLALLLEQEGLLGPAQKALEKAEKLVQGSTSPLLATQCSAVSINRARILSALGRNEESLSSWTSVNLSPTDLSSHLHLALTLFRAGQYAKSMKEYESAVEVAEENRKSSVLGACAMVAYASEDIDNCKTYLFRAFQISPPSLHVFIGLCVVGYLTLDLTLLQTALLETHKTIEWKSGDGQVLHNSCLLALRVILNSSKMSSDIVETASNVLKQLPNYPQYTEDPPLPLAVPMLVTSITGAVIPAQKLFHSYPTSLWSLAALVHTLQQNENLSVRLKTRYYLSNDIAMENSARVYIKHIKMLKMWLK